MRFAANASYVHYVETHRNSKDFPMETKTMKGDELVAIRTFSSEVDAEMAREQLRSKGIRAGISKDDAGGMYPDYQYIHGVRLLVLDRERKKADEVLVAMGI